MDLSVGIKDLSSGKANKLVLEFISKLKLSHADTKRTHIEEQVDATEDGKEKRTKEKQGKSQRRSVKKRVRSVLVRDKTV